MTKGDDGYLTITLTGRAPVKIVKKDWPVVAEARDCDGETEGTSDHRWALRIRRRYDSNASLVYGTWRSEVGEPDRRGGELVPSGGDECAAVIRVAEYLGFGRELADRCIARLPAEIL